MSEYAKKYDRPCPPCANCGSELYEKFLGNGGGWAKTDKVTDEAHGERQCVRLLRAKVVAITTIIDGWDRNPDRSDGAVKSVALGAIFDVIMA